MSQYTEEQRDYYKAKIRDLIALRSRVSAREVGKALNIDKGYALELIKEVLAEARKDLDDKKVVEHLTQANITFDLVNDRLFSIAVGEESTNRERIVALREIGRNRERQLKVMFDTGIFKRQLGNLSIEQEEKRVSAADIVGHILQSVDNDTRHRISAIVSDFLERFKQSNPVPAVPS